MDKRRKKCEELLAPVLEAAEEVCKKTMHGVRLKNMKLREKQAKFKQEIATLKKENL